MKEIQGEEGKNFMEGRGYSEFYRNTSEEMFIKTMMESSIGMPAPTMEMLGFKNFSQNFVLAYSIMYTQFKAHLMMF